MNYKTLFFMVMTAAAGCSIAPPRNVTLELPVSTADACTPLKTNVYWVKMDDKLKWMDSPKGASVEVPSDATSIGVNCEEMGKLPKGCDGAEVPIFMNAQEFLVDLNNGSDYTLECKIVGWSTLEPRIQLFVTKPYQDQLQPVTH